MNVDRPLPLELDDVFYSNPPQIRELTEEIFWRNIACCSVCGSVFSAHECHGVRF